MSDFLVSRVGPRSFRIEPESLEATVWMQNRFENKATTLPAVKMCRVIADLIQIEGFTVAYVPEQQRC
jgi:hypothetical protein